MKKLTFALWVLVVAAAPLAAGQEWWRGGECGSVYWLTHKMHWPQSPADIEDGLNPRLDVSLGRVVLADDFVCTETGPIQYIVIWGGFLNNVLPEGGSDSLTFELSIYADVPATGDNWSRPGRQMWTRIFDPGRYTRRTKDNRWTEAWYDPADGVYLPERAEELQEREEYSFCIEEEPFVQEQGTIYWLAVRDLSADPNEYTFGWTTTGLEKRWNDRAVYLQTEDEGWIELSYPEEHRLVGQPLGLAFVIGNGEASPKHDLGDAPDSSNSVAGATMTAYDGVTAHYPTVYNAGSPPYGPMHLMPRDRFYLGDAVSLENEADIGLDGDDPRFDHIGKSGPVNNLDGPLNWPDLDGHDDGLVRPLQFPSVGQNSTLDYRVNVVDPAATSAYVNIWCDWNRDGDWSDTLVGPGGELIPEWAVQNDTPIFAGAGEYVFTSPSFRCWHPEGRELDPIWVRITLAEQRWTPPTSAPSSGGAGPVGGYQYGETEDYVIQLFDWGDAPDDPAVPGYPTLAAHNGARHVLANWWVVGASGPWLGDTRNPAQPDDEPDGQPDEHALGDDNMGDDEDGVSIPPMIRGLSTDATVEVNGGGGVVQIWVDFNADRAWSAEEKVLDSFLADGIHEFSFRVPFGAVIGKTFARARISTAGGLNPDGPAADGEVEDHEVEIVVSPIRYDWGDARDSLAVPGYPVLAAHDGARHVIGGPWLGSDSGTDSGDEDTWGANDSPDAEEDGQPDAHARGDDNDGKDDEDGVLIPPMTAGLSTSATIKVSGGGGVVQLWIDFNGDKTWQTGEMVFNGFRPDGVYAIPFGVPSTAVVGKTFARARISTRGGLAPEGPAADGEVEDHEAEIIAPAPTILPAAVTQCPVVATTCPTVLTKCPPTQTQCPAEATKCPSASTTCPPMQTYCPAESTKCPASSTKCPPVQTTCPPSKTQCPSVETECPLTPTKCVTVYTECPAVQTYCPAAETKCPVVSTSCPAVSTQCPLSVTRCPPILTLCPKTLTKCSVCGLTESDLEPTAGPGKLQSECPVVETDCRSVMEYLMTAMAEQQETPG